MRMKKLRINYEIMKKPLSLLFVLVGLGNAPAQGSLQFAAHLTGNTDYVGDGIFSLTGSIFNYDVKIPYAFTYNIADIHGPGSNGPIIFSLNLVSCQIPQAGFPGGCSFRGNFNLNDNQIVEVANNQWYVTSFDLRGQIMQVAEPSSLTLIALGISFACLCFGRVRTAKSTE